MNQHLKRYLISSLVTFLSVFLITAGSSVGHLDTTAALTGSVAVSILAAAIRAAVKAVIEGAIAAIRASQAQ